MKRRIIKTASAVILIILNMYCAIDVPEEASEYLAPPVISSCERSGKKIIIKFSGYNDEYYFDGYNVYVSNSSLNRELVAAYRPVQIEGYPSAEPSFPVNPEDYDPVKTREIVLYQYYWLSDGEYIPYPFSDEDTYYIFLCSHHRLGSVLPGGVSNQVTSPGNRE